MTAAMTPTAAAGGMPPTGRAKPRSNDTRASSTDPDARPFRKSRNTAAIVAFQGHVLTENPPLAGGVVGPFVAHADGLGERSAALNMFDASPDKQAESAAADLAQEMRDFTETCRQRRIRPHVASNSDTRIDGSAIHRRALQFA
jgi:hypothetical protein